MHSHHVNIAADSSEEHRMHIPSWKWRKLNMELRRTLSSSRSRS